MTMFTTVPNQLLTKSPVVMGEYDSFAVTPSDGTDLPLSESGQNVQRIKVTGAGNLNVNLAGGGTAVLTGLSAGQTVTCSVTRILATSTTATGVIGCFGQT